MFSIIAVGKMRQKAELELVDRYAKRIRPKLSIIEVGEAKGGPEETKYKETQALLSAVPNRSVVISLDEGGKNYSSLVFANIMQKWIDESRPISFLIGGAEGLHHAAIQRSDLVLSLGSLTWPHMLVRILLAEQIYRAQSILQGHPYHRQGRP
ncbi:23S rRNA (pseudouridine(1915)-N(3))-methyltransferase RlmH [Commensalibacter papalotli (ex Servin-Garciduenas et al. 2014)]|uniref:Ribosomal RNA large subunit methyltransferase H n=1 Tax=Commensalibacter papalotli (ex Servin-Garciduenas et al. 2014) TaxID=1208583 RepID=W7DY55_9PROT|nr:23S rRNA (pseudouridine(1915)-N(3))-methyltransferase RlmH [Commensalibacter papalotli (ex Servin-Garciduenas et al. 2014)]EUK17559.1 rRNA large subunit methyltransferase [Commensalibacter papalotli (ex Servin-Garciduenas et al. 2014)]